MGERNKIMNNQNKISIKVCGMTQMEQVQHLAELGVDYAGFIFYEKSPRYVIGEIQAEDLKQFTEIKKVGVFVNEDYDIILKAIDEYGLNAVQLHGDETPGFCRRLSPHVKVIKAFRISGEENLDELLSGYSKVVDYFLFDTKSKEYGGTGKKFNWDVLPRTAIGKPYFLSGGIGRGDVETISDFIGDNARDDLYALDLNSKFEDAPGLKNIPLLKTFLEQLKKTN